MLISLTKDMKEDVASINDAAKLKNNQIEGFEAAPFNSTQMRNS